MSKLLDRMLTITLREDLSQPVRFTGVHQFTRKEIEEMSQQLHWLAKDSRIQFKDDPK